MDNAVYGKTMENLRNRIDVKLVSMENLRNRIDVKLVSNKKDYLKWTSKPSYMSHKMFHNDLIAISKNEVTLTLNRPTYIGMCILELSKALMHEFHYD